jgi:tRNA/tmRNA/rRNA uracil-C5-methylase (TrmA/RlmC/RlmD family)
MFSAGNAPERHRVARFRCEGEVVVDMYAGIGYFTLPYLIHAGAQLVHACEWNPNAVTALRYIFMIVIINYIKAQRLSWFGHLHRMPEERMIEKVYKWKPMLRRPLGR